MVTGSPGWPSTFAAGVYDDREVPGLLPGPLWTVTDLEPDREWIESAELDLRHGVVRTSFLHDGTGHRVTAVRFASVARPGIMAIRIEGPSTSLVDAAPLCAPTDAEGLRISRFPDGEATEMTVVGNRGAIAAAAHQQIVDVDDQRCLTRLAAYAASDQDRIDRGVVRGELSRARRAGFDELRREHERVWEARWRDVGTDVLGDPEIDVAIRLAEYHLLISGAESTESAIGARALTGSAYRGHVFWDTDVFVVPALAGLSPPAARGALMYRWNRLQPARDRAHRAGRAGAWFPWESAHTGDDVTPRETDDLHGATIPILTGELEEHIVADVAWAVIRYFDWTADATFMRDHGGELLVETARYWASRLELDADGSAHIRNVIGPDEYHERVDDNTFTNVLARHNLRTASQLEGHFADVPEEERRAWARLADAIVDGFDSESRVYEQFAGYHTLAPSLVASIGAPPLSADVILGHDHIQRTQIIKQPDVLMAFHMVAGELEPDSLTANLDFYLPRTAHGSSLSPAICAGLLARAGRTDEAVELFELAARLDLDDTTGTTAGGVHIATMGGVWQALTEGFLGVGATRAGLAVNPQVPPHWGSIRHRFMFRGAPVVIEVDDDDLRVACEREISVTTQDEPSSRREHFFRRTTDGWMRR